MVHRAKDVQWLSIVRHDSKEFLLIDFSVLVEVKFINHSLSKSQVRSGSTETVIWTHSSSSSSLSPNCFATRRRLRSVIFPVLSSSKSWNARLISSIGSRAIIFSDTGSRNQKDVARMYGRVNEPSANRLHWPRENAL